MTENRERKGYHSLWLNGALHSVQAYDEQVGLLQEQFRECLTEKRYYEAIAIVRALGYTEALTNDDIGAGRVFDKGLLALLAMGSNHVADRHDWDGVDILLDCAFTLLESTEQMERTQGVKVLARSEYRLSLLQAMAYWKAWGGKGSLNRIMHPDGVIDEVVRIEEKVLPVIGKRGYSSIALKAWQDRLIWTHYAVIKLAARWAPSRLPRLLVIFADLGSHTPLFAGPGAFEGLSVDVDREYMYWDWELWKAWVSLFHSEMGRYEFTPRIMRELHEKRVAALEANQDNDALPFCRNGWEAEVRAMLPVLRQQFHLEVGSG